MKIKRILAVMLAGAMMLSMAACGGESKEESAAQPSAEQKTIDGNVLDAEQYFNGYLGADPTTLDGVIGNDNIGGGVLKKMAKTSVRAQALNPGNPMKMVPYGPSICAKTPGATVSLLKHRTMFTPS